VADREALLAQTFVEVADTLVDEYDIVDFLSGLATRCVELFDTVEAGLMVAEAPGAVQVVASSSHQMHLLELFEVQHDQGPCLDCYRTGEAVECADLSTATDRWPTFAPEALAAGFSSVHALPMRLRNEVIGSLNLLRRPSGSLDHTDLRAAQALADVATIGILQHRAAAEARMLAEQLQYALNSRVTIEQAKGVLSERSGLDAETAFAALRRYARNHNLRLVDVASGVVNRTLDAGAITPRQPPTPRPDAPPPTGPKP
jgi:transcriptional regulator with GAF, ATPase, and Fis domain